MLESLKYWEKCFSAMGRTHAAGNQEGLHRGLDIGLVLARDVEGAAMRRRGNGDGQSALDRDSPLKSQELYCDLPLVVIHGDNAIVVTVAGFQENGVGRKGPSRRISLGIGLAHRGSDDVDLLTPAGAALPGVGIQPRYRHSGMLKPSHAEG